MPKKCYPITVTKKTCTEKFILHISSSMVNGYILFAKSVNSKLIKENPSLTYEQISQRIKDLWSSLSSEAKDDYDKRAEAISFDEDVNLEKIKVGIIQMMGSTTKEENLRKAAEGVEQCAINGAHIVVLPEIFNSPYNTGSFKQYCEPEEGPSWQALSKMAKENGVYLVGGSIPELCCSKIYNTCFVFNPKGEQIARHRKVHLFDIDVKGGQRFKESDSLTPGNEVTTFPTPFGIIGICICFDFRFPELARLMVLRGASLIIVPAAFNMTTGPAHWELMFRQRAVDNQCFTIGCAPARNASDSYVSYGNSIVVSPWGDVIFRADEKEQTSVVEINMNMVESIRKQLPLLSARRNDLYSLKSNTQNNLIIDKATPDDIYEIHNLLNKAADELHNKSIMQWPDGFSIMYIQSHINFFYCAIENGRIIGVFALEPNSLISSRFNNSYYLSKFALHPSHWRKGYGDIILQKAIEIARESNKSILLDVYYKNEKLKSFYQRNGFKYIQDLPEDHYWISIFHHN